MKKYLVEFIGTFFLTFSVAAGVVYATAPGEGALSFAPLAIGLVLMALCYAGAHISGAHFNPAVTLGAFIRGRCEHKDVAPYIISQLLAALVGGAAASVVTGQTAALAMSFDNTVAVIMAEFIFTFGLVFVSLNSTTATGNEGNSFYGLAIGGIYAAGIMTVGSISLGGFNPSVSLMLAMSGKLAWIDSWMHFIPQIIGGFAAGFAFKAVCPEGD